MAAKIPMKVLAALLIAVGAGLNSDTAAAAGKSAGLQADRIQISYVQPKNPAHEPILKLLKERQVLEKFKGLLSPLRLPRPLTLKMLGASVCSIRKATLVRTSLTSLSQM